MYTCYSGGEAPNAFIKMIYFSWNLKSSRTLESNTPYLKNVQIRKITNCKYKCKLNPKIMCCDNLTAFTDKTLKYKFFVIMVFRMLPRLPFNCSLTMYCVLMFPLQLYYILYETICFIIPGPHLKESRKLICRCFRSISQRYPSTPLSILVLISYCSILLSSVRGTDRKKGQDGKKALTTDPNWRNIVRQF